MQDIFYLAGIVAAAISISGITFQLIRIIRIKEARSQSYSGLALIATSLFLWILFGISLNDPVIFFVNVIGFILFIAQIILKYRYRHA